MKTLSPNNVQRQEKWQDKLLDNWWAAHQYEYMDVGYTREMLFCGYNDAWVWIYVDPPGRVQRFLCDFEELAEIKRK